MALNIHELLTYAVQNNASDIHLSAGEVPAVRIDGEIRRIDAPPLTADETRRIAYSIMTEKQKMRFEKQLETDFSIGLKGLARFRVNIFTHTRGPGVVLRQIPTKVLTLEDIRAPKVFTTIANFRKGLVLVTGPTGAGKSTTLAAMIDHINKTRSEHILTIEDPVEFVHTPDKCIINQREVGAHTHSFSNALRSALREDPDVILVGELRDLETISLALSAAETGHLVFGTLHTNSCPETIDRIIDAYPHEQQAQVRTMLSTSLMAVITQRLVKRYKQPGRVPALEIMVVNSAVRNLIRENKLFQIPSVMQSARGEGMQTMEASPIELVAKRIISADEAIAASNNPRLLDGVDLDAVRRRQSPARSPSRGGGFRR